MSDKKISELPIASTVQPTDLSVLVSRGTNYQFAFSTLLQFISSGLSVGANISFGITLPQNTTGKDGDVFINTSVGNIAQRTSGAWAIAYTLPASSSGATDGTVLYGLGIPASTTGNNNDTYINTGTGIFYKKSGGAWAQVFSMQTGPAGAQGTAGTNGTNGTNGKTILNGTTDPSNLSTGTDGDFYINTSTFTFFGPKTAGVWPTGTSLAGADGPAGPKGDTGSPGPTGADGNGVVAGGTTGQVLAKVDSTDYHTQWITPSGGGSVSGLTPNEILFGKSDGTISQDSELQYDPVTKSLYKGVASVPFINGNIYWEGDSITAGTLGEGIRFAQIVSNTLGCTEINNGTPSSTLENRSPVDPLGAANMASRISSIPVKGIDDRYICYLYGINDVFYNGTNYTASNFQTDYETIIDATIAKGWNPNEILIMSTTWCDPSNYIGGGSGGTPAPDLTRHEAFNTAAQNVAVSRNTLWFDVFSWVRDRGGSVNQNGIHPNGQGQTIIAAGILNTLIRKVYNNNQSFASSGSVEFLDLVLKSNYIVPEIGSQILAIDDAGKVGYTDSLKASMRLYSPFLMGGLTQNGAMIPSVTHTNALYFAESTILSASHNNNIDWYGSIELCDTGASTNFRVSYPNGAFRFFNHDGTVLAATISASGQLLVGNAETADSNTGDVCIPHSAALAGSVGGYKSGIIPLDSTNGITFTNNIGAGKIRFILSGGTNGGVLESWNINPDGSFENIISGQGIILKSSGGNRFKITVSDTGVLTTTAL